MAAFDKASVVYDTSTPEVIKVSDNHKTLETAAGDANDGYYNEIDYFADCLLDNREPVLCTPESSLETIRLCYRHIG
jgi:hypothetical protein